jgi:beta-glucosidase/6-phospho-beta-glucosidase/beta-galactosidase
MSSEPIKANRGPFLWGVATSPYQSEGGYNGPQQPQTNWATPEERKEVMKTGAASEFLSRYREDFERCRKMGLNAFRLGMEWSRVQPTLSNEAGPAPGFDAAALDQYAKMFAECRRAGMEPVVTLHHFVHPAWLGPDPWLHPATPEKFTAYARHAVAHVNKKLADEYAMAPLKYFITINEPNMLVLNSYLGHQFPARAAGGIQTMSRAWNQLLRGHIAAYNALHDLYAERGWPAPRVSINNYCSDVYWSDKLLLDLLCARERGIARHQLAAYVTDSACDFAHAFRKARLPLHKDLAYYFGALTKRFTDWYGHRHFKSSDFGSAMDDLYASPRARVLDYIGLDYYDPFAAHVFRLPVLWDHEFKDKSMRSWVLNTVTSKWWDWRVLPRGLHFFCQTYAQDFGRPVLIAENGMALRRRPDNQASGRRDKFTRSDFLRLHLREVTRIVNDGIPLIGYLHWSLFDNYEWGSFTPRFGLYSLDYQHGTDRLEEDHTGDRPSETYCALIAKAREKMRREP